MVAATDRIQVIKLGPATATGKEEFHSTPFQDNHRHWATMSNRASWICRWMMSECPSGVPPFHQDRIQEVTPTGDIKAKRCILKVHGAEVAIFETGFVRQPLDQL
jgi:hypothetical protein